MSEPCARPSHPEAGFTLVETLVALAVLALLLGTLATTLNVMGNAMRRGSRDIDRVDMIARGLAAVRRDMMRMERVVARDKTGTRFVFSGTRQSVSFVVVEPNYPAEPGSYQISYDVRGSGAAAELVRTRDAYEPDRAPAKGKRDESSDVVVLEGPYRFAFSFLERDGTRVRWVERWSNRRRLPSLIRLEMTATTPSVASIPALVVRPRMDAEVACLGQKSTSCALKNGGLLPDADTAKQLTPGTLPSGVLQPGVQQPGVQQPGVQQVGQTPVQP